MPVEPTEWDVARAGSLHESDEYRLRDEAYNALDFAVTTLGMARVQAYLARK